MKAEQNLEERVARELAGGATGCSGGCQNRPCDVDYSSAADILAALGLDDDGANVLVDRDDLQRALAYLPKREMAHARLAGLLQSQSGDSR